ncbi:acyltransferase family protein [Nocardioides zeae]|uniref:Peptidoglycan/LPS O-acetylase OafA/YrhL n=1 Tax=Nocardioides zeae TaxID=1457234 RepID=A0AAJ1X0A3_9ACTN|nr:acyltransferase [Nocardioides zeae]MDQ1104378.1 peptidoglycan/LPS O-acetylase OafA/YrhL [Nocardioides zeae]
MNEESPTGVATATPAPATVRTTSSTSSTSAASAPSDARSPRAPWFPVLDTLRGVGAIAIVTTHCAYWAGAYEDTRTGWLLARLDVGVALFFVLSGFLLARPHFAAARAGTAAPALGTYVRHRIWRIAPLAVLTVLLAFVLLEGNHGLTTTERIAALTLTSTYVVETGFPGGLTHLWSLTTEVAFYALLPAVMVLAVGRGGRAGLRPARIAALVAGMVAISVAWFFVLPHRDAPGGTLPLGDTITGSVLAHGEPELWLPGYLAWFAGGVALAAAYELVRAGRRSRALAWTQALAVRPAVCLALAAALMWWSASPVLGLPTLSRVTPDEHALKTVVYLVVASLVVLTGVFTRPGLYTRLLAHPVLRRLGTLSYGVFCLHLVVLHLVLQNAGWEHGEAPLHVLLPVVLGISLVAAEVAHRLVEAPAMRIARRRR